MSFDRRLGFGGLIVGLFGIGAFYLWPDKKWIGWICVGVAAVLVLIWLLLELRMRDDDPIPSLSDALHAAAASGNSNRTITSITHRVDGGIDFEGTVTRTIDRTLFEKEKQSGPIVPLNGADLTLSLLHERRRLETELQPLLEIEECGIKVVPLLKVGKDESDYRKEQIERLRRDIAEITKQIEKQRELEAGNRNTTQAITSKEWQNLADRFHKLPTYTRADYQNSEGVESWRICGGGQDRECEILCQLAGAMLLRSTSVRTNFSNAIRAESDDVSRWLYFVKESNLTSMRYGHATQETKDGDERILLFGTLDGLPSLSYLACLRCAGLEV